MIENLSPVFPLNWVDEPSLHDYVNQAASSAASENLSDNTPMKSDGDLIIIFLMPEIVWLHKKLPGVTIIMCKIMCGMVVKYL